MSPLAVTSIVPAALSAVVTIADPGFNHTLPGVTTSMLAPFAPTPGAMISAPASIVTLSARTERLVPVTVTITPAPIPSPRALTASAPFTVFAVAITHGPGGGALQNA